MTVINEQTGEIVEFDREKAQRRADRIRQHIHGMADNREAMLAEIRDAVEQRDDMALGYRSIGDYVREEFQGALTRLDIEVRRAVVGELTQAGMSTRAIAPVVGVSKDTVQRDIVAGVSHETPQTPAPAALGEDLPERGTTPEGGASSREEPAHVPAPAPPRPPVVGIDGKEYSRPAPSKPRRSPLTDSFFRTLHDARKRVESLHRLTEDDRWPQNAEKVAAAHRNDLLRINDLLQQVIKSLPEEEATR